MRPYGDHSCARTALGLYAQTAETEKAAGRLKAFFSARYHLGPIQNLAFVVLGSGWSYLGGKLRMGERPGGEDWDLLSPEEKVVYCLKMAEQALASAEQGNVDLRQSNIELASQWNLMAKELQDRLQLARTGLIPSQIPNRDRL